jgi:hypothetical protein
MQRTALRAAADAERSTASYECRTYQINAPPGQLKAFDCFAFLGKHIITKKSAVLCV